MWEMGDMEWGVWSVEGVGGLQGEEADGDGG
jgi:hypothetical protein